ncbi:hypothetical protein JXB28_04095 [Candidatus Woesearchaeota archaeon]|nr:hypothetical protein [Candidatus Woesearchaeota archaeon]
MVNQAIDDVLKQLNSLPLEEGQPYLLIKKKRPACYVIKNLAKIGYGKEEFDIDLINIPVSKIEELAEKALSSEAKEATLEVKAERYIHKADCGNAFYHQNGKCPRRVDLKVELYLRLNEGIPDFRIKYDKK